MELKRFEKLFKVKFSVSKEIYSYLRDEIGFEFVDDYLSRLIVQNQLGGESQ